MSNPINHHYVPAFYLNYWGSPEDTSRYKEVHSFCFYNGHFTSKPRRTKSICSVKNLNIRKSEKEEEMYKIEAVFLKQFDDKASKVHRKIINRGLNSLSDEERSLYTCFLMGLKIRQPDAVQKMKEYGEDFVINELNETGFVEEYKKLNPSGSFPDTPEELIREQMPDMIPNFGIDTMVRIMTGENDDRFHSLFLNMHWFVKDFSLLPFNLLTCDYPCYFSTGLDNPKCIFAIPLSPRKALFAVHDRKIKKKLLQSSINNKLAEELNKTMVNQAHTWVIGTDETCKDMIHNNLGKGRKPPLNF